MKRIYKTIIFAALIMMMAFAFAACGGSGGTSGGGSSDGGSSNQAAAQTVKSERTEHNTLLEDPSWGYDIAYVNRIVFGKLGDYKSSVKNNIKNGDFVSMADDLFYEGSVEEAGIIGVMDDNESAKIFYVLSDDTMYFPETADYKFFPATALSLQEIVFDNVSTEYVTDMSSLFSGMERLESLDLSSFDTSNVTTMNRMFDGCTALKTVNLSGLDTSNVIDMISMFEKCQNLESLDLSSFRTPNLEEMADAFRNCDSLTELDLSSFDGSKLDPSSYTDDYTFASCDNLSKIIVSQSMYDAFYYEDSSLFSNGKEVIIKK